MEHGPFWLNFIISTSISEKIKYFKCLYKIWSKTISFDMRKEKGKSKINHRKNEKKGEFESPRNESLVFQKGYANHAWSLFHFFSSPQVFQVNPTLGLTPPLFFLIFVQTLHLTIN
jgi:hypothetical protein